MAPGFVLMLIINASVLARDDEHFAQGAFCPGHPVATDVPRLPKVFANDYSGAAASHGQTGRKVPLTLAYRH
jgi:hypothetical protein